MDPGGCLVLVWDSCVRQSPGLDLHLDLRLVVVVVVVVAVAAVVERLGLLPRRREWKVPPPHIVMLEILPGKLRTC